MQFLALFLAAHLAAVARANSSAACEATNGTHPNNFQRRSQCLCGSATCNSATPFCNRPKYGKDICSKGPVPDCRHRNGETANAMRNGEQCHCFYRVCDHAKPFCVSPSDKNAWAMSRCSERPLPACKVTDGRARNDFEGDNKCLCGDVVCNHAKPFCNRPKYGKDMCSEKPLPDCTHRNGESRNLMTEEEQCHCYFKVCNRAQPFCVSPTKENSWSKNRCSKGLLPACTVTNGQARNDIEGENKCLCGDAVCTSDRPFCNRPKYGKDMCSDRPLPDCQYRNGASTNALAAGEQCHCYSLVCTHDQPYCNASSRQNSWAKSRCSKELSPACTITDGAQPNDLHGQSKCLCGNVVCDSTKPFCNRPQYGKDMCSESPLPDCTNRNGAKRNQMTGEGKCHCYFKVCDNAHPYCVSPSTENSWARNTCNRQSLAEQPQVGPLEAEEANVSDTLLGKQCWVQCERTSGPCNFCGYGNKCCRKGWKNGEKGCFADEGEKDHHVCVEGQANTCQCTNGTPVGSHLCPEHDAQKCARCNDNYHLDREEKCVANTCRCPNGSPVGYQACPYDNAHKCASCTGNYHRVDDRCEAAEEEAPTTEATTTTTSTSHTDATTSGDVLRTATQSTATLITAAPVTTPTTTPTETPSATPTITQTTTPTTTPTETLSATRTITQATTPNTTPSATPTEAPTTTPTATLTSAKPVTALGSKTITNGNRFSVVAVMMFSVVVAVMILMILFVLRLCRRRTNLGQDPEEGRESSCATSSV